MTAPGAASQGSARARLAALGVLAVGVAVALSAGRLHTPPAIEALSSTVPGEVPAAGLARLG